MEKPKMSLSDFRGHCEKVQALPIMHLIDRVMHLTIAAEKAVTQLPCLCKTQANHCPRCALTQVLDKHGYQEPLS